MLFMYLLFQPRFIELCEVDSKVKDMLGSFGLTDSSLIADSCSDVNDISQLLSKNW